MSEAPTAAFDLTDCAREPIHIPGAIQPHGYLFILNAGDHAVIAVSQNVADTLEVSPSDMVGRPVSEFLVSTTAAGLDETLGRPGPDLPVRVVMRRPGGSQELNGVVRVADGLRLLELEAATSAERLSNLFGELRTAIERIRHSDSTDAACQALAGEVRRLSGFDRVMVYRFDDDWNGEVVAEERSSGVHSYLRHSFPASDIPPQARALYLLNRVRIIPDARGEPSPIAPHLHPSTGQPFDLSDVTLRAVSPVHLEYLRNMGVAASMSISIIRDNQLWGLVACHNSSPRILSQDDLQSCDLLAQATAWCLDSNDRAAVALTLAAARRLEPDLERAKYPDFRRRLQSIQAQLFAASRADGMAIWSSEGVWGIGMRPSSPQLKVLAEWLSATGQDRVTTDRLSRLYPLASAFAFRASGMVAVRLGAGWLMWFRTEWAHSLIWAGRPDRAHRRDAATGRINPRRSFVAWRQKVRGRSVPWTLADLSAVDEVRALVMRALVSDQMHQLTENERALTEAKLFAEAATQAKSVFLAQMSHEIRTPLNGVLGMAQVMATEPLTDPQRDRLKVIQKSGSHLLAILNDVLDLSKIEAGRLDLEETTFDITDLADEVFHVFGSIAAAKSLGFFLEIDEEARGIWQGDPARVRQLLSNLVSNALKFTPEGEVVVTVEAPTPAEVKVLKISVADTGIGILPEALPGLFDSFSQADSSVTRRFGGTGLGLTICKHIAELMGGDVTARSEIGKGSVFEVCLPLVWQHPGDARQEGDWARPEEVAEVASLAVLAAEDNETNQSVLRAMLGSLGVTVEIVENGRQAVEAWTTGRFDMVLMDIQMPVLDGLLATSEIRRAEAAHSLARTPIIAFSANAMKHQIAEYLAAGFDGFLAKPVVVAELFATLENVAVGKLRVLAA